MPGVAEPDIALDIVSLDSGISEVDGFRKSVFTPRPRLAMRTLGLIGIDAGVTIFAAIACFTLFHPLKDVPAAVFLPVACLTACTNLSFFERALYAAPEIVSRTPNWRKISLAWLQAVAVSALSIFVLSWVSEGISGRPQGLAGLLRGPWLPALLVCGFGAIALGRLAFARAWAGPAPLNRTVVIGDHDSIRDLVTRIRGGARPSFDVVGLFEHGDEPHTPIRSVACRSFMGLPLFSGLATLEWMIRKDAVDTVLVAVPWSAGDRAQAIIKRVSMAPVDVYVYPGMNTFETAARRVAGVSELPLLRACSRPIDGWGAIIKRAEDIVLALSILAFISPVMMTIAALVKITSKGPVFFRQRRLGYNNRVIEVLKFRSMYTHLADADAQQQTCRGDKRVTNIGAWLRRTSLDELPQLLNVLKGDMSLVGPRPHALATTAGGLALEEAVPAYPSRHRVKPGITGWAQVNGYRGALDSVDKIVHRVNHDLYYIENWSLALDLKILWLTVRLVFADDNAF